MKKWLNAQCAKLHAAITCERGDTNFISILIILGLVILLSAVFMGFKDTIVAKVQEIMDGFVIQ